MAMLLKTTNNQVSFKYFLSKLAEVFQGTLVMDNASIHHASDDRMKELGFKVIYLAPYLPESNACEFLFRTAKQKLRRTITRLRHLRSRGLLEASTEDIINLQ